jgi:hypothetical protein
VSDAVGAPESEEYQDPNESGAAGTPAQPDQPAQPGEQQVRVAQDVNATSGGVAIVGGRDTHVGSVTVNHLKLDERFGRDALPVEALEPVGPDTNPLFGRDADLAALEAAFDPGRGGARTVVLTGSRVVRGLGRTALARQFAGRALAEGRYPGGVFYVNLAEQEAGQGVDAQRALPGLLAHIGTQIDAIPTLPAQQVPMYRARSAALESSQGVMLLVVDGVASHQQVEMLHPHGKHHVLLIPNRPLSPESGRTEIAISPLGAQSSAALLTRVLAGRNPHFAGPGNEYKLTRLGWITAGLPKAQELVARYLSADPEADLPGAVSDLADAIDALPARPRSISTLLLDAAELIGVPATADSAAQPLGLAGRTAVTTWITEDWRAGRPARWEIAGDSGTGKTSLFNALAERIRKIAGAAVILVSADVLAQKLDIVAGDADQDVDILPFCRATVESVAEDIAPVLPSVAQDLYNLRLIAETPEALLEGTIEFLKRAAGDGESTMRFAFLTDNVDDALLNDHCRNWLLALATGIGCPVVASVKPNTSTWMRSAVRLQLSTLGPDQLERFALAADGTPLLTSAQAARIVRLTKGLPAYVAGALKPIFDRPHNVDQILDVYEAKTVEGGGIQVAHLYNARQAIDEISVGCVSRPEAELDLFDLLAVLRTFKGETLTALLAKYELEERAVEQLVEQICGLRSVVVDLDGSGRYQVHSLLVDARSTEMTPQHLRRVHKHIEEVLYSMLDDFEPGAAYVAQQVEWTQFENPEWNELAIEWFYHAGMSQDTKMIRDMQIRLSLLYFRAMWWYGWFAPVYICEMAPLEAVRLTARRSEADRAWAKALSDVQAGYPHTWDKARADPAGWRRAAEGLNYVLRQIRVTPAAAESDSSAVELAAYLNAFLADCARFNPGSVSGAHKSYIDAAREFGRAVFTEDDDAWNFPWFDIFDAEALIDAGDLPAARAMLRTVLEFEDDDNDLRTRFLIAASRIARDGADLAEAVTVGARAVLHGYIYNIVQEEVNQAPSRYSQHLHQESLFELATTLDLLQTTDPAARAAAGSQIAAYFEPYWREAATDQVAAEPDRWTPQAAAAASTAELLERFVPPPPANEDLGRIDSEYASRTERFRLRVEPELAWPPAGWQTAGVGRTRRLLRRLKFRRTKPAR